LIAAALIAIGAATGGGGVALGGKGAFDIKQARDKLKASARRYEQRRAATEMRLAATNLGLEHLGEEQEQALIDVVVRMAEFLRRHEKQVRQSEHLLVDGVDATMTRVPGLAGLDVEAVAWVTGALASTAVGAGVGSSVTAAASSFGVASTGAAISGLSGAAAESATLAFLGGGSLATGGGGMALGATALNFVTIGPALLVGGFVIKGQGSKARTQARLFEAKITLGIAELDEMDVRLAGIDARVREISDVLGKLKARGVAALDALESEPFEPERHAARFQTALMLVLAVRDVAATPVIDARGVLSGEAAELVVIYRPMVEE
jgi:hypothetical protein